MARTFTAEWMPAPYSAWGVFIREGRHQICPIYYCNTADAEDRARKHAAQLESEYQPNLF